MKTAASLLIITIILSSTSAFAGKKSPAAAFADCNVTFEGQAAKDAIGPTGVATDKWCLLLAKSVEKTGTLPTTLPAENLTMSVPEFADPKDPKTILLGDLAMVHLPKEFRLGTRAFDQNIHNLRSLSLKPLLADEATFLENLNQQILDARQHVADYLISLEKESIRTNDRLMTEDELNQAIAQVTGTRPAFKLDDLVPQTKINSLATWRNYALTNKTLNTNLSNAFYKSFGEMVKNNSAIPETDEDFFDMLAFKQKISVKELKSYFGEGKVFASVDGFIDGAKEKYPAYFKSMVDRRILTAKMKADMLDDIRNHTNSIYMDLAEGQYLREEDFQMIKRVADELDAPMIFAPAFADLANVDSGTLAFLLKQPRVYLMTDEILEINKGVFVVNNGRPDKAKNPLLDMNVVFGPTDRVLVMHPRRMAESNPSLYRRLVDSWIMTTGSMSDPAYLSSHNIQRATAFEAQMAAEGNRGFRVLSRGYRDPELGGLTNSANDIAPRWIPLTDSYYGQPAGLVDMGKLFTPTATISLPKIPAVVLPDIHLGTTDPEFLMALWGMLLKLNVLVENPNHGPGEAQYKQGPVKVGTFVLHDLVDGGPFNGHAIDRLLAKAAMDSNGSLSIENHFSYAATFLNMMQRLFPDTTFLIPADNHGYEWLFKAINKDISDGMYRPGEFPVILSLMRDQIIKGGNPYERILREYGLQGDHVRFVGPDEWYKAGVDITRPELDGILAGVELGQHGQMGTNGAKGGNVAANRRTGGNIITGHTHTGIENASGGSVGAGITDQSYEGGASKKANTIGVVYTPQAVQYYRLTRGVYLPNDDSQSPEQFFQPGYPKGITLSKDAAAPAVDQYRAPPRVRH